MAKGEAANRPEDLDHFREELTLLYPKFYSVATVADDYEWISAPVEQISQLADCVLIVTIGASISILSLVVLLFPYMPALSLSFALPTSPQKTSSMRMRFALLLPMSCFTLL